MCGHETTPSAGLSRRRVLRGAAAAAVGVGFVGAQAPARAAERVRPPETRQLRATLGGLFEYRELPFDVPPGVTRIDVRMTKSDAGAKIGIGLFDSRGSGYQSPGFRGIHGEERSEFFVSTADASEGFVPGPIPAGRWTVLIPVFVAGIVTVTVDITMSFGEQGPDFAPGAPVGVVLDRPGWYRGDLHCHTTASSDAWASGSAMSPAQWAATCRRIGLDYAAMTDHNVISQNYFLARDAGEDMLLMPGEEMTNWEHGHATVSGMPVGEWLDFRQTPRPWPTPRNFARVDDFMSAANSMGAYVSAAHPSGFHLAWKFTPEMFARTAARTHGYEVWTGPWGPDDELSLITWDGMLSKGIRIFANGGSDLHGVSNTGGFVAGTPTTVVYAARLAQPDVIAALKAGRSFVTRRPDGVELYVTGEIGTASGSASQAQRVYTGGTLHGAIGDRAAITFRVRRAGGMRMNIVADGILREVVRIGSDDETITRTFPVTALGYVRADVRSAPRGLEGDMEAVTNPIFLREGNRPAGWVDEVAPVPEQPGPRRRTQG